MQTLKDVDPELGHSWGFLWSHDGQCQTDFRSWHVSNTDIIHEIETLKFPYFILLYAVANSMYYVFAS